MRLVDRKLALAASAVVLIVFMALSAGLMVLPYILGGLLGACR